MPTGFQSNYIDSGYTVPKNNIQFYNPAGNLITATSISPSDIYTNSQQVGVYMLNGTNTLSTGPVAMYPIFCNLSNLNNLGIPNGVDDSWLVYPGYGFTLFTETNYGGTYTNSYINTSNSPVLFSTETSGFNPAGTPIMTYATYSQPSVPYPSNKTFSVQIFFRFQPIQINGLS